MYAVIMAGGVGTRLWPRSRQNIPKQFLDIVAEDTMLQETFTRIEPLIPPDRVFVITNGTYAPIVWEQIPQLPRDNVIAEPAGRNTAPCIGLAALYLRQLDPEGMMIVLPADHLIRQVGDMDYVLAREARIPYTIEWESILWKARTFMLLL